MFKKKMGSDLDMAQTSEHCYKHILSVVETFSCKFCPGSKIVANLWPLLT